MRLLACLVLVLAERGINLAVPIMYKSMVETLSDTNGFLPNLLKALWQAAAATDPAAGAAAAAAGSTASPPAAAAGLVSVSGAAVGAAGMDLAGVAATGGGWGPLASLRSLLGTAAAGSPVNVLSSAQDSALTAFWTIFYPWAFFYLGAVFLRGGSGSEGLLANVRDICWIPINQAAFRRISTDVFGHLLALDLNFHVHRKTGQIMRILDRGTSSIQVRWSNVGMWCATCGELLLHPTK
jgi:ATP-binding cassette subfamily B (MDR/TAP) protein 6